MRVNSGNRERSDCGHVNIMGTEMGAGVLTAAAAHADGTLLASARQPLLPEDQGANNNSTPHLGTTLEFSLEVTTASNKYCTKLCKRATKFCSTAAGRFNDEALRKSIFNE